jgi:mRNA interferase MazF
MAGKVRPMMVVSREDENPPRALAVCVPLTTQIRGGDYEVNLPRVRWMPGAAQGVANVQGITSIEFRRLERRTGRFDTPVITEVRKAVAWMLELNAP